MTAFSSVSHLQPVYWGFEIPALRPLLSNRFLRRSSSLNEKSAGSLSALHRDLRKRCVAARAGSERLRRHPDRFLPRSLPSLSLSTVTPVWRGDFVGPPSDCSSSPRSRQTSGRQWPCCRSCKHIAVPLDLRESHRRDGLGLACSGRTRTPVLAALSHLEPARGGSMGFESKDRSAKPRAVAARLPKLLREDEEDDCNTHKASEIDAVIRCG